MSSNVSATGLAYLLGLSKGRVSQLTKEGRLDGCYIGEGRLRRYDADRVAKRLEKPERFVRAVQARATKARPVMLCENCGSRFLGYRTKHRFCSKGCCGQAYRAANSDSVANSQRSWQRRNRERLAQLSRDRRNADPESRRAERRRYYDAHRHEEIQRSREAINKNKAAVSAFALALSIPQIHKEITAMAKTNQNEAQIIARIEELKGDLALNFKQICELLVQVGSHYLHSEPMFRWYREVASEKLVPELIMAMGLKRDHLKHMMGRPRDVQLAVARDGDLSWCAVDRGEIIERRGSWKRMSGEEFKRMFPVGAGVRSVPEQRAILEESLATSPITHVRRQPRARVDRSAATFTLGNQTVPLTVVIAALAEVGIQTKTVNVVEMSVAG